MPLTTKTPPTITAAAAAAAAGLVTDRRRHLRPRTPAPPRKPLSHMSALARVSYGVHVSRERANVGVYQCQRRPGLGYRVSARASWAYSQPGLRPRPPLNINALCVNLVNIDVVD